jgi:hypothetical protein
LKKIRLQSGPKRNQKKAVPWAIEQLDDGDGQEAAGPEF